jgi:hypothetical protein
LENRKDARTVNDSRIVINLIVEKKERKTVGDL